MPVAAHRRRTLLGGVACLVVLFGGVLYLHPFPPAVMTAWDDLGQVLAPALGAAGCFAAYRRYRSAGPRRAWPWALMAAAVAAWGAGEAVWSWYELVAHRGVPFPSLADAGFLAFPAIAAAALLMWPARLTGRRMRISALLDGGAIGTALLMLAWTTSLGAAWRAGGQSPLAMIIGVAYPIGDVVLLSLLLLLLTRADYTDRAALLLCAAGITAAAVSDSFFVYATSSQTYTSGAITDTGWFAGFLLIGVAGAGVGGRARRLAAPDPAAVPLLMSWPRTVLPYVPTTLAATVFFSRLLSGRMPDAIVTWCAVTIFIAGTGRQFLVLAHNRTLLAHAQEGHAELRRQALHDPLTGLANRLLFTDRVEQALGVAARDGQPRAVVYVDLDDFKQINDRLGHAAGDQMLVEVATRLTSCVREGDTVARLGGDEFAVLLSGGNAHAREVAARIVDTLRTAFEHSGHPLAVTASVGVSVYPAGATPGELNASDVLAAADHAMYQAKGRGKNRYVMAGT
ncbi:MAG TPA: GGDEF domain-containing protein [Kineosporiaceae bacterium]|nr:GGDEF domain-containing protein [Kineosporiaceae bacterium]